MAGGAGRPSRRGWNSVGVVLGATLATLLVAITPVGVIVDGDSANAFNYVLLILTATLSLVFLVRLLLLRRQIARRKPS